MNKVIYVVCPQCKEKFYLEGSDYADKPDAPCHCPFCAREFKAREGASYPQSGHSS
jgi:hypothetical protein